MQAMSILGRVLLSLLVLLGSQGDAVTPRAHILLKESIRLLELLQQSEVSCNQTRVTNIFADNKAGNTTELLCRAATVAWEIQSCHKLVEGVSHNLLGLVWGNRTEDKKLCPVAAGSTTPLKNFFKELRQVLQEEFKSLQ